MKTLASLVVVLAVGLWFYQSKPTPPTPLSLDINQPRPSILPYSIESLRTRSYAASPITIEKTVRKTPDFTSYVVSYFSDGLKQRALMNVPNVPKPEAGFPVVVVAHGYIPPQDYSTENSYINTSAYFARSGFLVLKPDYRGHDQSEGETSFVFSRIGYTVDVMHLLTSLTHLPEANAQKVFMYGHSMGGDVALRVLETSNLVTAATLWAPAVTEFPESYFYFVRKNRPEELDRLTNELQTVARPENYSAFSALDHVGSVSVPLLIHHGTADESVPFSWSEVLVQRLNENGKNVMFYIYDRDNHDIAGHFGVALGRDVAFFKQFL